MKTYRVILIEPTSEGQEGWEAFLEQFSRAYRITPGQARDMIRRSRGVMYTYDLEGDAQQARRFLEGIGAAVEVVEEEVAAPSPPMAPPVTPPAGPGGAWRPVGPGPGPDAWPAPLNSEEKTLAMICHLGAFGGYVFPLGNIIIPLVIWLIKKDKSPFVDFHGKESLNFQISILIYSAVCLVLALVIIGIVLLIALFIFEVVVVILAAVAASNGQYYRYPLCIRLIT